MASSDLDYQYMAKLHERPWCWHCGKGLSDCPDWWFARWLIERAHIVNNPRICEVPYVILLCSWCHLVQHGTRIRCPGGVPNPPVLSVQNMLWLKQHRDPDNYDHKALDACYIGALPEPEPPEPRMLEQYLSLRD